MASRAIAGSLLRFLKAVPVIARSSWPGNLRVLVTAPPSGPGQMEGADSQIGASEMISPQTNMNDSQMSADSSRGMASSAAAVKETMDEVEDDATSEAESMADQMAGKAQHISEKAKQTVQDALGSSAGTAQKMKETVVSKAKDAKDFVKEKAQAMDESMESAMKTAEMGAKSAKYAVKSEASKLAANSPEVVKKAMNTKDFQS